MCIKDAIYFVNLNKLTIPFKRFKFSFKKKSKKHTHLFFIINNIISYKKYFLKCTIYCLNGCLANSR